MNRRNMIGLLVAAPLLPSSVKALIRAPQAIDPTPPKSAPEEDNSTHISLHNTFEEWRLRPRYPVAESNNPTVQDLIRTARTGNRITFLYEGGSDPGSTRIATVECIFSHKDSPIIYMAAYCHLRGGHRIFRTDRLEII